MVLAAALGLAVLRSTGMEPLASANAADLATPVHDVISALLHREARSPTETQT